MNSLDYVTNLSVTRRDGYYYGTVSYGNNTKVGHVTGPTALGVLDGLGDIIIGWEKHDERETNP